MPPITFKLHSSLHCLYQYGENGCDVGFLAVSNSFAAIFLRVQTWEIEKKVVCVVRDNATNIVSGLHTANIASLPCRAHSLQLIIKDGVLSKPVVVQLLNCARSLVGHHHCSNVAFNAFRQMQSQLNLSEHVLIKDIATHWNT